ncbi:1079_t:CDS:2, partial [Racocetra fulgida]
LGCIDSKIAAFVLKNKHIIEKYYYDHPLFCHVVDMTLFGDKDKDILSSCLKQIFSSELLSLLMKLPKICNLSTEQKKDVDSAIEIIQDGRSYDQSEYDYDSYKCKSSSHQNDLITQRKPDVWATTNINGNLYELMYGEVSGMPFDPDSIHIEEDRRKLFRLGVRGKRKFQVMFLDHPGKLYRATSFTPVDIPVQSSQKHKFKAFAIKVCEVYQVLKNIGNEVRYIMDEIDKNEINNAIITPINGSPLNSPTISKTPPKK